MIVDCHTHVWESVEQLGRCSAGSLERLARECRCGPAELADTQRHLAASRPTDRTVVLGFKSRHLEANIPNELVARYVRQHPDKLIGFAGIDPTEPAEALEEIRYAREELGMQGLAIAPAAQNFHPLHTHAMRIYAEAEALRMPILVHAGIDLAPDSKLEFARPGPLDEVAREFPNLILVIAHLGYPWVHETLVLLGKHTNVYAHVAALLRRPWQAYNGLLHAYQYGVIDKLLFGSDFPHAAAASCIETLYSINHLCHGTNLPTIPREQLRGIVERDALAVLGIAPPAVQPTPAAHAPMLDDED